MIQQKPIHATPPHLQCMLLHMQKYDYAIQYKPGKEMVLADHLSPFPSLKESLPIPTHQNIQHIQLSTDKLDAIRGSIEHDPVYITLYHLTIGACPDHLQHIPRISHHFWGTWDELSIKTSILLKVDWVCPHKLANCTFADLHATQQGMKNAVPSQRGSLLAQHWCPICTKHKASPPTQPMLPQDIPNGLWQEITADYFYNTGKEYILICDLFNRYPFLFKITSKSALSLFQKYKS